MNPREWGFADGADAGAGAKRLVYLWDRKKIGVNKANYWLSLLYAGQCP